MIAKNEVLYLALADNIEESGWGICSKYLGQELSKLINVVDLQKRKPLHGLGKIGGTILHAIANTTMKKIVPISGYFDAGYCFFESYLAQEYIDTARQYDLIFTGSTYCTEILESYGLKNVKTLIQGIDPDIWNPITKPKDSAYRDYFVIYSGGKFEMRKGQDIVLAAVKVLQEKYKDIFLVNCWENAWTHSFNTMGASPYIRLVDHGASWVERMAAIYATNGMFMGRCMSYPLVPHQKLREIIRNSDLGVFLSRCEGGTNLAMMEYMATGKPVVATMTSGHKDVLTNDNCFPVLGMDPTPLKADGVEVALWDEPDFDEVVAQIEFAYLNRDEAKRIGANGAKSMRKWTWARMAKQALSDIILARMDVPSVHKPQRREDFGTYLNALGLTGNAVEIGVQRGEFSEVLRESWKGNVLHLVDRWEPAYGYDDIANEEDHAENFKLCQKKFSSNNGVNLIKMSSEIASHLFNDEHFDFIYIDADHSYEGCKADIAAWFPKLKAGGIMAGHDYIEGHVKDVGVFGVKRAVAEFSDKHNLQFRLTQEEDWRSWYVRKQ